MLYIVLGNSLFMDEISEFMSDSVLRLEDESIISLKLQTQTIKEYILSEDDRSCVLIHDEQHTVPLEEALFLRETCEAEKVYDWCCSPEWDLYVKEASNAPLLEKSNKFFMSSSGEYHFDSSANPFTAVLFGMNVNEKWDDKKYSYRIEKDSVDINDYIRNAIVKWIVMQCKRKYSVQQYESILEANNLNIVRIGEQLRQGVAAESFYEDDFQWDQLFSKRKSVNIDRLIRLRLNQFDRGVEVNIGHVMDSIRSGIQSLLTQYGQDSKYGPVFIYRVFKNHFLPNIDKYLKETNAELGLQCAAEWNLRNDMDKIADTASRASRFGMEREMAIEDYVNALESYYVCLLRQSSLKSLRRVYEDMKKDSLKVVKQFEEIVGKWQDYVSEYKDVYEKKDHCALPLREFDNAIVNQLLFETKFSDLEKMLKAKYADDIVDIVKIRERNAFVRLFEDRITWSNVVNVELSNQMTAAFEQRLKNERERKTLYRLWITQLFDEKVLRKTDNGFEIRKQKLLPMPNINGMQMVELLMLHMKLESQVQEEIAVSIPVNGRLDALVDYLQCNPKVMRLLDQQSDIRKKNCAIKNWCRSELAMTVPEQLE